MSQAQDLYESLLTRAMSRAFSGPIAFGLTSTATQFLWRAPHDSHEAAQHVIGIAESEAPGDLLERLVPVLDQWPR